VSADADDDDDDVNPPIRSREPSMKPSRNTDHDSQGRTLETEEDDDIATAKRSKTLPRKGRILRTTNAPLNADSSIAPAIDHGSLESLGFDYFTVKLNTSTYITNRA
jgi:hypothetical protein